MSWRRSSPQFIKLTWAKTLSFEPKTLKVFEAFPFSWISPPNRSIFKRFDKQIFVLICRVRPFHLYASTTHPIGIGIGIQRGTKAKSTAHRPLHTKVSLCVGVLQSLFFFVIRFHTNLTQKTAVCVCESGRWCERDGADGEQREKEIRRTHPEEEGRKLPPKKEGRKKKRNGERSMVPRDTAQQRKIYEKA